MDEDFRKHLCRLRRLSAGLLCFLDRVLLVDDIRIQWPDSRLYLRARNEIVRILAKPGFENFNESDLVPYDNLRHAESGSGKRDWEEKRRPLSNSLGNIEALCVSHDIDSGTLEEADRGLLAELDPSSTLDPLEAFAALGGATQGYFQKIARLYERARALNARLPFDLEEKTRVPPVLVLCDISEAERKGSYVAKIVGYGPFAGLNKRIGVRELFFLYHLFDSAEVRGSEPRSTTVISQEEVARALVKWSNAGHLTLEGRDVARPSDRVQKMWREFVKQMEKEPKLKALFTVDKTTGHTFYGIQLHTAVTQILITSLPGIFESPSQPT